MIDVTNLHKAYGEETVLDGASFAVDAGTIVAMVGPNGSGKTTTLHVLAGLATPDDGSAIVDGMDVTTDRAAAQERLAFLPQDVRFHSALTPRQVLRFYAGLRDVSTDRLDARLDQVALLDAADDPCGTLSGGMRQRLGLALLDLADAPVLLLDEPALSLDPDWRDVLMDRLQTRAQEGATVLLATHLHEVWRPIVDQVLRCEDGQIRAVEEEANPVAA
ncbi:MAG: heme ABC exporter ATP-binding protein CcmA [Salinibacter sp.]|uniref:heme ABC exporter ATP-binding protein CcmA n=1 Tax=Salinibacter sp. TaxID=2065818 RepID=UPI0035D3E916